MTHNGLTRALALADRLARAVTPAVADQWPTLGFLREGYLKERARPMRGGVATIAELTDALALKIGREILERRRRACRAGKHWYGDARKESRCLMCRRAVKRLGQRRSGSLLKYGRGPIR